MTLRGALIWGMEKGRGQEARQRFKAPETPQLMEQAGMMPFDGFIYDFAHVRNENAPGTWGR